MVALADDRRGSGDMAPEYLNDDFIDMATTKFNEFVYGIGRFLNGLAPGF